MAGDKETYEIDLNPDQMAFVQAAKDKYNLSDEGKVMRVIMDYLISTPDVHETVFTQVRCLRCG